MYNMSVFYTKERADVRIYKTLKFEGFHHYSYGPHANKISSRQRNNGRSKKTLLNLINANFKKNKCVFITLTFKENLQDLDIANKCFYSYIRKIRRDNPKVKYLCTIEFQKRGAIHYHVLFKNIYNVDYGDYINKWRKTIDRSSIVVKGGSVRVEFIDDTDNLINYISKYMSKEMTNESLCGKKCYLISKGLVRPDFNRRIIDSRYDLKKLDHYVPEIKNMKLKEQKTYKDSYTEEPIKYLVYEKENFK
ncbi:conserved hypothetical protein (plasmid) [Levilactobacillus brevis KB290]|uniref:Replication-associated protein ORF2/G2P domain-containing protein n=2 Tax=Levilactobacillus brevis TaxID=1580 RepID=M5AH68_LEVBR|nr:conserved hypothetical protein [Levilactobacillus brevis KB290]